MNPSHHREFVDLITERRSTCLETDYATKSSGHLSINPGKGVDSHVPGMETVIVTVSGYDSLTRTKLVKLINYIGALNTGSLSICNTHVVCWRFVGRKYELAKKLRKKIISHRWFEDCLKAGALLPEEPYLNKSGEEEIPLCWNDSVVDLPHSKALRKGDSTRSLSESLSHPESSSCWDAKPSTGVQGLSAYIGRSAHVDNSDTGWSLPTSSKRTVSSHPLPRVGIHQAVFSSAAHLLVEQRRGLCSEKALKLSDDGAKQTELPDANQLPAELWTGKVVGFSDPIRPPFTDNLDTDGIRHQSWKANSSRSYSAEDGQQVRQSCFPHVEHYTSGEHEGYKADYAQIRQRRRKEVEVPSGGLSEKYQKLMNESPTLTSCKLAYGDERAGSQGRTFSARYLGSPSYGHSSWRTISAGVEVDKQRDSHILANKDDADFVEEEAVVSASSSNDIACVICHTETKPTTEGLLECGHRYCYPCIQKWADEATSKQSTCPLCKASFEFITIRELERSADEDICTQVLEERVVLVGKQIRQGQKINLLCPSTESICIMCESKDSPELLMTCSRCVQRSCHTFCLDPPLPSGSSWLCSRCLPMRSSFFLRETVMSRFST